MIFLKHSLISITILVTTISVMEATPKKELSMYQFIKI